MGNKIKVSIAQRLDVPNIFKDVPNFMKDASNFVNNVSNFVKMYQECQCSFQGGE